MTDHWPGLPKPDPIRHRLELQQTTSARSLPGRQGNRPTRRHQALPELRRHREAEADAVTPASSTALAGRPAGRDFYLRPFPPTGPTGHPWPNGSAMALRPCLDCRRLTTGSRCADCERPRARATQRSKRQRRPYSAAEKRRRAAAVDRWRATYGDWCPGWQREAHPSGDLVADHVAPVAAGGPESGPLRVLCRSCNSARGARP